VAQLWDRDWLIHVDTIGLTGHHAEFEITKSLKREPNSCDLVIYGLNPEHRAQLQELQPKEGSTRGIPLKLEAGYQGERSLLWLGDLRTASSIRAPEGWVTRLSSGDGEKAIKNSQINLPLGPKTEVSTAIRNLVKALGVDAGNVESIAGRIRLRTGGKTFTGAKVLAGSTARILDDVARSADLEWSIQDGAVLLLERGKAIPEEAFRLTPETGLIGSPTVANDGTLTAQALMIPGIRPGKIVIIQSESTNGQFRLEECAYRGRTFGDDWFVNMKGKRY
jgi:hypothetical protein